MFRNGCRKYFKSSLCSSGTYLLIEELACLLLDGVNELYLSCWETHQQGHTLCCRCEVVEVMTCGLRSLVNALVYWFAQVSSLEKEGKGMETKKIVIRDDFAKLGVGHKIFAFCVSSQNILRRTLEELKWPFHFIPLVRKQTEAFSQ